MYPRPINIRPTRVIGITPRPPPRQTPFEVEREKFRRTLPPRTRATWGACPENFTEEDIEKYKQKLMTELWGYFFELVSMGKVNDNAISCIIGFNIRSEFFEKAKTIEDKWTALGLISWPVDCIEAEHDKAKSLFRHEGNIKKSIEKFSTLLQDPMLDNMVKSQLKNILSSITVNPQVTIPTSVENNPVKVCTKCNSVFRQNMSNCENCKSKLLNLRCLK